MFLAKKTQAFVVAIVLVGAGSLALARMQLGEERAIPYQGILEQDGVASEGAFTLRFTLFGTAIDGTAVWTEDQVVDVNGGRFAVVLGDGSGAVLSDAVLATPALFLEVAVVDDDDVVTTLSPRQEIIPVPLAARAAGVVDGSITRRSLGPDVRFGATITHTPEAGFVVAREVPAGWIVQIAGPESGGEVLLFTNSGNTPLICVTSPLSPGIFVSSEVIPFLNTFPTFVRMRDTANARVNAGFNIICEVL